MQQTLFTILTNEQVRTSETIEASLSNEVTDSAPWFTKVFIEASDTDQTMQQ